MRSKLQGVSYKLQEANSKASVRFVESLFGTLMCATQQAIQQSDGRWLPKRKTADNMRLADKTDEHFIKWLSAFGF